MADEKDQQTTNQQIDQSENKAETGSASGEGESQVSAEVSGQGQGQAGQQQDVNEKIKTLEAELAKVSQRAASTETLMQTLAPFVERGFGAQQEQSQEPPEQDLGMTTDDESTFISRADHKKAIQELRTELLSTVRGTLLEQHLRQQYPDLADKGPKEDAFQGFARKRINALNPAQRRVQDAVARALDEAAQDTRNWLRSIEQTGESKAKTDQQKKDQQAKEKQAAGIAASGLSSSGVSAPQAPPAVPTQEQHLQQMRTDQIKTKQIGV